ncbi:hypothetical protein ACLKA7_004013 [Drosophila subpalustris]
MAKDPATTRIPRLDGISRIPPPGSFSGGLNMANGNTIGSSSCTTSHIRPPTTTATALKSTTQIFRRPTLPANKARPISSYHPTVTPLHDLGVNIKKSASGERLNNAVTLISKRTTTVLKKYFGQGKMMGNSGGGATASIMTSSLPQTPLPASKQPQQQQPQLTSSTPMPLMRSETFVCDEEEAHEDQDQEEQQTPNRINLESTRLSSVGFGRTLDLDTTSMNKTRPVLPGRDQNVTHIVSPMSCAHRTRPIIAAAGSEELSSPSDCTRILASSRDRTRTVIPPCSEESSKEVKNPANLTQSMDLTKSMDQLPLLEHMSIPAGLDVLSDKPEMEHDHEMVLNATDLDVTLTALAPDKTNMKLPLNSTINTERLLDISGLQSPARHIQLLNLTREFLEQSSPQRLTGHGGRRSMAQQSLLCLTPQSATTTPHGARFHQSPVPVHLLSPLLKAARSDLVLPTRTPEGELPHLDATLTAVHGALRTPRTRYSFGLELQETTLDASIDLVDNSFSASQQQLQQLQQQLLKRQHSFDLDESLGILTPDQMKEFLDSSSQHNNQSHQLELQLAAAAAVHHQHQQQHQQQQLQQQLQQQQQLRMEQTPSPEELPLDPIEPQLVAAIVAPLVQPAAVVVSGSATAKLSNSFITSVTSVTSLDTGYQGDGEMSRPASRGACDHSPSNGPHLGRVSRQPSFPPVPAAAPMRRQDPMTDSDFFTESDADDVLQRGDRRAQVIDGQLYGPAMQPSASVPQLEDSCMESSGIFTDVENRCDEEMRLPELEIDMDMDVDMSPDDSTQTMRKTQGQAQALSHEQQQYSQQQQQQRPLSSSSAATLSLSNRTSYCSVDGGSAKSFCDEAFNASISSSVGSEQQQQQQQRSSAAFSVQRAASPRQQHAASSSLTSLCTIENVSSSSSPVADVKSKVSTTRANMAGPTNVTANKSGNATSSASSSCSPRITPSLRRSPSATPAIVKRSSSSKPASPSASASASTRQPQDKGSVGAGVNVFARLSKSPTSPTAPAAAAKRLQPVLVKRGRSYSKDSQKSSHSDLSSLCNGGGSPKLLAKTPLRK